MNQRTEQWGWSLTYCCVYVSGVLGIGGNHKVSHDMQYMSHDNDDIVIQWFSGNQYIASQIMIIRYWLLIGSLWNKNKYNKL